MKYFICILILSTQLFANDREEIGTDVMLRTGTISALLYGSIKASDAYDKAAEVYAQQKATSELKGSDQGRKIQELTVKRSEKQKKLQRISGNAAVFIKNLKAVQADLEIANSPTKDIDAQSKVLIQRKLDEMNKQRDKTRGKITRYTHSISELRADMNDRRGLIAMKVKKLIENGTIPESQGLKALGFIKKGLPTLAVISLLDALRGIAFEEDKDLYAFLGTKEKISHEEILTMAIEEQNLLMASTFDDIDGNCSIDINP